MFFVEIFTYNQHNHAAYNNGKYNVFKAYIYFVFRIQNVLCWSSRES